MRKVVLATGEIYHIVNRGIEKRQIFTDKREYQRALLAIDYYRFSDLSAGLAQVLNLEIEKRNFFLSQVRKHNKLIDLLAYCLMPNHFHLLIKQLEEGGIKEFVSNFSNSYVRYFNTKNKRVGPLFQGVFRAVRIEDDEQLIHVSRYIHINPVVSFIVPREELITYPYTSFPECFGGEGICNQNMILDQFPSLEQYESFVYDQIDYGRRLELIKHLILE